MDTLWLILAGTAIEGMCAERIARKFKNATPSWKYYIPIYNVWNYGKFSLVSTHYLVALTLIQAIDLVLSFAKDTNPFVSSTQPLISFTSFLMWAIMVARIAERLGQGFWNYLAATILSAVASSFAGVALLHIVVPSFHLGVSPIPWWAEAVAIIITSLPFLSLAFDRKVQFEDKKDLP